ncbi:hypothetical protein M8542_47400 [Amycolatopsis sp. OK19-0408]|uniref:Sel1 repeat family protein n=1 Tax=Amycolatopsis iheyensis TaxID=2945988 RepID=A0A9X2NPD1_9PSEU|nr:hypothetical protein [Amycolatopsis iheyensis]MCR6490457.1 hypothetical protein [Amycolatopsis iheyensis]
MIADELYRDAFRLERGSSVDDLPEIERLYRRAAARGSAAAMGRLGLLLEGRTRAEFEGHSAAQAVGDLAEALEWYEKAAKAGHSDAAFFLGRLYSEKLGDWAKAEPWYRRAARAGNSDARDRLAAGPHGPVRRQPNLRAGYAVLALLAVLVLVALTC